MSFFSYKACENSGQKISGLVEAPTLKEAVNLLRERGLFVININPHKDTLSFHAIQARLSRVGFADIVDFTRQIATMVNAGLPLTDALVLLRKQSRNPALGSVISEVLREVEGGSSLAKSLERFPKLFSSTYVSLIRAGEAAGMLDELLLKLADNLEKSKEFRSKVKGAMIYPIIIVIAMAIVVSIMMIFVVPKLTSLYRDLDVELPTPTKILIAVSDFFVNYWYIGLVGLFLLFIGFNKWKRTNMGKRILDTLSFVIPVFGPLRKNIALVEFTRTFGILISAGVPVLESISIVSEAMDNIHVKESMERVSTSVEKGSTLAEPMERISLFPPIVSQMISVGEKTGKLDESLIKLSHYFEVEAEQGVKALTTALEPIIMVVLGVGVGFLVWSVISPIYNLTSKF